jgi:hypothetical protein
MNRPIVSAGLAVALVVFALGASRTIDKAMTERMARPPVAGSPVIPKTIVLNLNGGAFTCTLAGTAYICHLPVYPGAMRGPRP